MKDTIAEEIHDLGKKASRQLGPCLHQLVGIYTKITDVIPKGPKPYFGVFIKVSFAELKETAKGFSGYENSGLWPRPQAN